MVVLVQPVSHYGFLEKYLLFGLRIVTVVLLLLVLLQPRLEFRNVQPIPNSIAVLLDDSKSLSIKTFPSEKPRIDLVKEALEKMPRPSSG